MNKEDELDCSGFKWINESNKKFKQDQEAFKNKQRVAKIEQKRAIVKGTLIKTSLALMGVLVIWYGIASYQTKEKYGEPYDISSDNNHRLYGSEMVYDIDGEEVPVFKANVREMPAVLKDLFGSNTTDVAKGK